MKELLEKIKQEIKRLENEDIIPAKTNVQNLKDERIEKMADRFIAYKEVLEKALGEENPTNTIAEYANHVYKDINWTSSEMKDVDNRIDSFKILVSILNLMISREQKKNYLDLKLSKDNTEKIINILDTRER